MVPDEKLLNYLLSSEHPVGKTKAAIFDALGFGISNAEKLKERLIMIFYEGRLICHVESAYGRKSIIDGSLTSPTGKAKELRTVWLETEVGLARFVTAYPAPSRKEPSDD